MILVVEDEWVVREMLGEMMEQLGYRPADSCIHLPIASMTQTRAYRGKILRWNRQILPRRTGENEEPKDTNSPAPGDERPSGP